MIRFLFTIILISSALFLQAKEIRFNVKIENPTTMEFSLSYIENQFTDEERGFMFSLKSGNESHFVLDIASPGMITFRYGQESFKFFVELNDSPEIRFNADNLMGTLQFSGGGATNNNFFAKFQRDFPSAAFGRNYSQDLLPSVWDDDIVRLADTMSESEFTQYINSIKSRQLARLSGSGVSAAFSSFLKSRIKFRAAGLQLLYLVTNKWNYDPSTLGSRASSLSALSGLNRNDANLIGHPDFVAFLSSYVYAKSLAGPEDYRGDAFTYYQTVKREFTGKVRDFLLTKLFFNAWRFGHSALVDEHYPEFRRACAFQEYKSFLDDSFGASMAFDEEGPAPGFSLLDMNSKTVSLSDFRGKVVYLSFWATWCKPCLKGFEKSRYVREELEKKGVILINISVDKKISTWKETMARVPMPGINLISQDNEILRIYDIASLPVYHIINKNGKFTYLPEGARDVLEEFEKLVRE